jgi:hypothetical protein
MLKLLMVALVALLLMTPFIATQTADATGYSPAYYALRANLIDGRQKHVEWVAYLERNPGAYVPPDVTSLEWQRHWVQVYDMRLYAIWLLANGYTQWSNGASIYQTTYDDFVWNRQAHYNQASWTYTYSGREMQIFFAEQYSWRIAMLQFITTENWPSYGGWLWLPR